MHETEKIRQTVYANEQCILLPPSAACFDGTYGGYWSTDDVGCLDGARNLTVAVVDARCFSN